MQQVLALESDLLEYDDIFDGSRVIDAKVEQIKSAAREQLSRIDEMGGVVTAVESGYLKSQLVAAHADRRRRVENGDEVVVGVNAFTTTEPSPLTSDLDEAIYRVDPEVEQQAIDSVRAWRAQRDNAAAEAAIEHLIADANTGVNLMDASLRCARAGVTTGEWATALRGVFGEYRAPTGVSGAVATGDRKGLAELREDVANAGERYGHRLRILVAKPGLDGHSNGAEQVAVAARDAGFEVIYQGIRLTAQEIVSAAVQEDVDCVGISVLSGSHLQAVPPILEGLKEAGMGDVPVIVGGIIPESDGRLLLQQGVAAIFTPKDYDLTAVMRRVLEVIEGSKTLVS